jgi:hypothetical protein
MRVFRCVYNLLLILSENANILWATWNSVALIIKQLIETLKYEEWR